MSLTIYHNPNCMTSRNVLRLLRDAGLAPQVVDYLKTPPTRARMQELLAAMGMTPRDILRRSGTPYDELGLDDPALTDDQILDALEAHPILMQRPIVASDKGVRLCRPLERVHGSWRSERAFSRLKRRSRSAFPNPHPDRWRGRPSPQGGGYAG